MSAWRPLVVAALAAAGLGLSVLWVVDHPEPLILQGEVEATRVDLAARVGGRVVAAPVDVGARIAKGDLLIELDSPALKAGLGTAKAALAVAESNRDLAFSTRQEVIDARRAEMEKAAADVVLAQKTYDRVSQLQERSFASEQVLDEVSNKLNAAMRAKAATEANLQLAIQGNSSEQKAVAVAQVEQAAAAVNQIEVDLAELAVKAPMSGEITARSAEIGELFGAGTPLLSIVDVDNAWFTFNVREDLLNGLAVGDSLKIRVPALGGREVEAKVTVINAQGTYANWRATKATGDFDLRTFEVRARPDGVVDGLRPGMSGLIDWSGPRLLDR